MARQAVRTDTDEKLGAKSDHLDPHVGNDGPDPSVESSVESSVSRRSGAPAFGVPVAIVTVVTALCAAVVFSYLFATVFSGVQEQRDQHQLYAEFRGLLDPSSIDAPKIGGAIADGFPVALLSSPHAHIHNLVVVEGTSSQDLLAGPGHLADTPLPGQPGNAVLLGKSTTAGAPFHDIGLLARGDIIDVTTGQGTFRYTVVDSRAGDARPTKLRSPSVLTLVTGHWSVGTNDTAGLQYVDATRRGAAVAAPAHQPRTVLRSDAPGSNESAAVPLVVFWTALLVVLSMLCWWLWSRWGLLRTWLIGAPVLFAVLWLLSSQAMRLLPNVY